VSVTSSNQMIA